MNLKEILDNCSKIQNTDNNPFALEDLNRLILKMKEINKDRKLSEPKFISSEYCADFIQFRFPRSKKKRIRNKWSKQDENFKTVPWNYFLYDEMNNIYYGHQELINKLKLHEYLKSS